MKTVSTNPITYKTFTPEEEIVHHLVLKTASLKKNGLFHGKMGIAIAFLEYGRHRNIPVYTDFGLELKNSFPQKIDDRVGRDFATGLSGFGWGLEYMAQTNFIDWHEIHPICLDIDEKVIAMDMRRINNLSIENGLEGLLHYILIRLKGLKLNDKLPAFDRIYLGDTYEKVKSLSEENISVQLQILKQIFIHYMDTGILTYQPEILRFINPIDVEKIEDILSAKLGLPDGLAGCLLNKVYQPKN